MNLKAVEAKTDSSAESPPVIPSIADRRTDEIVVAVVGPLGSGCTTVSENLKAQLNADYGYEVEIYKVSDVIRESLSGTASPIGVGAERVTNLQKQGNELRRKFGDDYLVAKVIEKIAQWRDSQATGESMGGEPVSKKCRRVHIIDSLKNPGELRLLRETYGDMFWLFGVFAPRKVINQRLSAGKGMTAEQIEQVIGRDYSEVEQYGQSVRDTFYQSDFFVRNDQQNDSRLVDIVRRYLEILFGVSVHTPTLDESSMYAAYAEAAGSACLSRQVGAAIVSDAKEVIGLGRNDVPTFTGGLYRTEDGDNDHRCYRWGGKICHNDDRKEKLYRAIHTSLAASGFLVDGCKVGDVASSVRQTDVRSLIEYSRAVHAEMEAIISVGRGHKAGLVGSTLYCTTYPCHSCARHILASGISRVVYVEPYPKSLAMDLHFDAVSEDESEIGKKLVFLQYTGVAPKHILRLFKSSKERKTEGKLATFDKKSAPPVLAVSLDDYSTHERYVVARLLQKESANEKAAQSTLFAT